MKKETWQSFMPTTHLQSELGFSKIQAAQPRACPVILDKSFPFS